MAGFIRAGQVVTFVTGGLVGAFVVMSLDRGDLGAATESASGSGAVESASISEHAERVTNVAAQRFEAVPATQARSGEPAAQAAERYPSNTPAIYLEMMGLPVEKVTVQDLHATFEQEPRHDAWAFAVENALAQKIVDLNIAEWAVVEQIECRAMTCEIAGYYTGDGEPRAPQIVQSIDRVVWFHDNMSSRTHVANPDGFDRFLTIVTARSMPSRRRTPKPLVEPD